ncbi:MAG: class I SAM-dependent methyltransferase [Ilumatobacter sp.]
MHSEVWSVDDAATYDDDVAVMFGPEALNPAVDFLAGIASGGRALEFAIGSGRVALALADQGVEVVGVELSQPMIDVMRSKLGSDRVPVVSGDMASTRVDGTFRVVYLVFNTITNLQTQEAQVACFENAAAHLEPGGCFVIETFVPALQRIPFGECLVPFDVSDDHIGIDEYDIANQMLVSHHVSVRPNGTTRSSGRFRYAWPAEYDLMAQIAGMRLRERWADWNRSPFASTSTSHVSVWEKTN